MSDNALSGADVNESSLDTPEAAYSKSDAAVALPEDSSERLIASRTVEAGNYVVFAKTSLSSGGGEFVNCRIRTVRPGLTSTIDEATNLTVKPTFGLPGAWETVSLMGLVGYSGGNIGVHLLCAGDGVRTDHTRLVALKVNRFVGTDAP